MTSKKNNTRNDQKKRDLQVVTQKGTIVPNMRTRTPYDNLSSVLFGKTRSAVLSLLYGHSDEEFYLREISRTIGVGLGALQREVRQLADSGLIRRTVRGRQVYYQANKDCPVFSEIRGLMIKTAGIADVLRSCLSHLEDRVDVAFVFGSLSRGAEQRESDIDVMVVGEVSFADVAQAFERSQEILGREVNPTVYPAKEFKQKASKGHHFIKTVLSDSKIFLIGTERELERLGQERLAR